MDALAYLRACAEELEPHLERLLPPEDKPPCQLHAAMRYAVLGGGKRLRPALLLAAAEACGGRREALYEAACAVEFVHAYSLIHDDLPAMDDAELRRGRPACHRVFGEAVAILAGDGLQALAMEVLARPLAGVPAERQLQAVRILAEASGPAGMVAGQALDLAGEARDISHLQELEEKKTGALLAAACQIGALLAGADDRALACLGAYGRLFGLAFQITDDILDVVGDPRQTGKPTGSDARLGKATFVTLDGLEGARRRASDAARAALACLEPFGKKAESLRELVRFAVERDR